MGYSVIQRTGGTQECAKRCNDKKGCSSFNLYFERAPAVDPTVACPNPLSKTVLKCVYYRSPVSLSTATNNGQWRRKFQVLIAGSSGYAKCTTSQYWDSATRACTEFPTFNPDTQWLNKEMGTCVEFPVCDPDTQWLDRNTRSCIDYLVCNIDTQWLNRDTKSCVDYPVCNIHTEWLNKKAMECVSYPTCDSESQYLDKSKIECVAFPLCNTELEYLDKIAKKCVSYPTCNPDTHFLNKERKECVTFPLCNAESEFLDKAARECVAYAQCDSDTLFLNNEKNECVAFPLCNAESEFLDKAARECVAYAQCDPDTHFLNKEKNECVAYPSCDTDSEFLDKTARECVTYAYCDPDTHFLNKEKNECVAYPSCDTESEFLDKTAGECVPYAYCDPDTHFLNKEKNECISFPSCDPNSEYLDKTAGACVAHHCNLDTHWLNAFRLCMPYPICSTTEVLNKEKRRCECVAINLIENPHFKEKNVGWTPWNGQIGFVEIWTSSDPSKDWHFLFASFWSHLLTPLTMETQQSLSNLVIGRRYDLTVPIAVGAYKTSGGGICTVQIQVDSEPLGDAYTVGNRPEGHYEPVQRAFTAKASNHDLQLIFTCSGQNSVVSFDIHVDDVDLRDSTCVSPKSAKSFTNSQG